LAPPLKLRTHRLRPCPTKRSSEKEEASYETIEAPAKGAKEQTKTKTKTTAEAKAETEKKKQQRRRRQQQQHRIFKRQYAK